MSPKQIQSINTPRLLSWANQLNEAHATAAVVIGVGHDHVSGTTHLCTTHDLSREQLGHLLHKAALALLLPEE